MSDDALPGPTLRLRGPAGIPPLDPVCAHQSPADQIRRLFSRQLFTYAPVGDPDDWRALEPVPDLAAAVPSTYNAGLGASHTCYVVHLRPGVMWDTAPPRAVTAHDVVRGLKRMCNPVARPAAISYFTSTIRGMADFCAEYAASVGRETSDPRAFSDFQNTHGIPGVFALDDETLVIELVRPALDAIDILALPCAAAAPEEYDAFVPGGGDTLLDTRSNGPYRVAAHEPGAFLRLERNPVWNGDSDPVREQNVDAVEVTVERSGNARVTELVRSGAADLPWGVSLAEPRTEPPSSPGHRLGYSLDPYLVFNLDSPGGGPLDDVRVRRAVARAIDKGALARIAAGSGAGTAVRVADSIVPPGNDAARDPGRPPAADAGGDTDGARALLAEAGVDGGLRLTVVHPDGETDTAMARSYAADLEKAGVSVRLRALDPDSLRRALRGTGDGRDRGWDIAASSWSPGWFHHNARAFLQPLCDGPPGGWNLGGYANPEVDALIERALEAVADPKRRETAWSDVEDRVLEDLPVVPLLFQTPAAPRLRGARVREAVGMPSLGFSYDLATLRLSSEAPDEG
ncbi:ABC transporter substrate-binding protein [Nocardiopsis sp. FR6]|uniref:ABC transporter substrate-binding protein n=1 Tax=Nocardiopsis sp. FR6 TaxID=2605986 RepID=UPI001359CBBC|nr:ABC transporter substrate-binding protein [Nocardiopsis sp. FR6]